MGTTVSIHDKNFVKSISSAKIQRAISGIATKINKDFKDQQPLFISVLNGSFMFTADLLKKVKCECEVSFVKMASYSGTSSSGKVNELIGLNQDIKGRTVIVLEDIVDSGSTIQKLIPELKKRGPKTIKIATLFFKPDKYESDLKLDYIGIEVPGGFLVGYGLDYDGLGRNLSDIYTLKS